MDPSGVRVAGPLGAHAAGFVAELRRLGYTSDSAYGQMLLMAHASRWLAGEGLDAGGLTQDAAGRFLAARRASGYTGFLSAKALVPLLGFLRRAGVAPEAPAPVPAGPADALLDRFRHYLVSERGIGAETAGNYADRTRSFVSARLAAGADGLAATSAADVTAFVVESCPSMRQGTAKLTVTALRSLLRWLHLAGEVPVPLGWAVPSVASGKLASLPAPLEPSQVAAMLASCDTGTPGGLRDLAMLTLLARLGLRAGEVTVTGKGRRSARLPLPADAGEAIAGWLRDGRPDPFEGSRRVFLRIKAPHCGLTSSGVTQAVHAAAQRAGLGQVFAHRLRHTAATGMLRAGASLPEVGQVLRHRRLLTTAIYANSQELHLAGGLCPVSRLSLAS